MNRDVLVRSIEKRYCPMRTVDGEDVGGKGLLYGSYVCDSEGRRFFEGDIVECDVDGKMMRDVVVFDENHHCLSFLFSGVFLEDASMDGPVRIVGDIFRMPEKFPEI